MAEAINIFTREKISTPEDVEKPVPIDEAAIELLEDITARVRKGEIKSFVIVGETAEQGNMQAWTNSAFDSPYIFLGSLEEMKHRFLSYLSYINSDYDEDEE